MSRFTGDSKYLSITSSTLVENRAEGENIAARIGRIAFQLLRRHVLKRADDHAFIG